MIMKSATVTENKELLLSAEPVNLFGLDRESMNAFFSEWGEKQYRTVQIMKWIYHQRVTDLDQMTDISKKLRIRLAQQTSFELPTIATSQCSSDGTRKWLFELSDGSKVETVYIPEKERATLCVSTQVGCAQGCCFCATATLGFSRNLTSAEIVGQAWVAAGEIARHNDRDITNIVLMGMGEPLLNFKNSIIATNIFKEDLAFGLSKRRVTISTVGIVPAIRKMTESTDVSLAVSLHAATNETRDRLVPVNQKYPLEQLVPVCGQYIEGKLHRSITWEYVMLEGVNDSDQDARNLVSLIRGIPSKVNLIPFNPYNGCDFKCPDDDRMARFARVIHNSGITVTIRRSRGDDIAAACGQLVGASQQTGNGAEKE